MAKKERKVKNEVAETEFDMTPMIDCVFLLIVFFMLVSEFTKLDQHQLILPKADQAQQEEVVDQGRLVINVDKDGDIFVLGKRLSDDALLTRLKQEAKLSKKGEDGFPIQAVKIRADRTTEYRHIQKIMMMCMKSRLWKLSFGAMPEKE